MKKFFLIPSFVLLLLSYFTAQVSAHGGGNPITSYSEATILEINHTSNIIKQGIEGISTVDLVVKMDTGSLKGKTVTMKDSNVPNTMGEKLKPGDHIIVARNTDFVTGTEMFYMTDYVRKNQLFILFAVFLSFVLIIGRLQGLLSVGGMIISFLIIMNVIIPQIMNGVNPIGITLVGALIIIPLTFYMAHGINKHTTVAIIATFLTLAMTGALAVFFVDFTRLTGFAMEEAMFIQSIKGTVINIKNLLLAGIIIGALGVLDDITISQTSIVERLQHANPKYTFKELYSHSMKVGRDHIASLVNTLIIVYAGASLPLLLLFSDQHLSLVPVINHEIIATEIVRTLVSSIGIISAVPLATFLACIAIRKK